MGKKLDEELRDVYLLSFITGTNLNSSLLFPQESFVVVCEIDKENKHISSKNASFIKKNLTHTNYELNI